MAKGVVRLPPKDTKEEEEEEEEEKGFGLLGMARPPPTAGMGWPKPPLGPWGWFGHPQKPKTFFFFFFWPFGGGWTTLLAMKVVRPLSNRP
jgi:hypothetical protein